MSASAPAGCNTLPKGAQQESVVDSAEFRRRFRDLVDMWDTETFVYSFPHQICGHWAYEELLSLDEPAIPYMLGEIQRGNPNLVAALPSISGESPVQGSEPTTEEIVAAWSVGDAYDNAVVESFFATLQTELLDRQRWETRPQLAQAIFEYIQSWYNLETRHSYNNHQGPVNYRHQQVA